jgi:hypothetical protein
MREGQKVTVKALTAMPGVADGAVLHDVEWGPRLATLVDAGRYKVLDAGDTGASTTAAVDDGEPAGTAAAGDVDGGAAPTRRGRAR